MEKHIVMSTLPKTWIFDLDGTILKHNGYKTDGEDTVNSGVLDYLNKIPEEDFIVFLTSRTDEFKEKTINFLNKNAIRYDTIIFNAPFGERILINDRKPSGIDMAYAININRDNFDLPEITRET